MLNAQFRIRNCIATHLHDSDGERHLQRGGGRGSGGGAGVAGRGRGKQIG